MVDLGDFGIEVKFLDYSILKFNAEEATVVLQDLKDQIRARPEWTERSEHWEAIEALPGSFQNAPHLEGRVYSFNKEMAILKSRMTSKEREALNGQD